MVGWFMVLGAEPRTSNLPHLDNTQEHQANHPTAARSHSSGGAAAARGAGDSYLPQCTARFCPMDTNRLAGPCSHRHSWAHAAADLSSSSSQVCRGEMAQGTDVRRVEAEAPALGLSELWLCL